MREPETRVSWSLRRKLPRKIRLALVFSTFASLVTGSLLPGLAPSAQHGIDLGVHTAVYAVVTVFTVVLVERPLKSAMVILALSGAIEIMQSYVPGRAGSWSDLAANGSGIAVALAVMGVMSVLGYSVTRGKIGSQEANARPAK